MLGENRSFAVAKRGFPTTQNGKKTNKTSILFIGSSLTKNLNTEEKSFGVQVKFFIYGA